MELLISKADLRRNLVIPVCWLLGLWLHLLNKSMAWGEPINDVDAKHLQYLRVIESFKLTRKDSSLLPSSSNLRLQV